MTSLVGQARELVSRNRLMRHLGISPSGRRDYYETFDYPTDPGYEEFYQRYDRQDLAKALVNLHAEPTWRHHPTVLSIRDEEDAGPDAEPTEFEEAVDVLFENFKLTSYWERVDKVSLLGEYSLLFLGFQDGVAPDELDQPVSGSLAPITADSPGLTHMSVLPQNRVEEVHIVDDPTDERYGFPEKYRVDFGNGRKTDVHWTRVIHVAYDLLDSEWRGTPLLRSLINRLIDLEKTVGGAAEMTWRGADRKIVFDVDPEMGMVADEEQFKEEAEELVNDLRTTLYARGVDVSALEGEVVDPTGIVDVLMKLYAGGGGVPQRILTGSERGELASTQDRSTFYEFINHRQANEVLDAVIRPTLDRLVEFGVLPDPGEDGYEVEFESLFELTDLEVAELREKNAAALKNASPMGDPGTIASNGEIRQEIMDWEPVIGAMVEGDIPTDVPPEEAPPGPDSDSDSDAPGGDDFADTGEPDELDESDEGVQETFLRRHRDVHGTTAD